MPLPLDNNTDQWPPKNLQNVFGSMAQWSAWYANDVAKLQAAYGGGTTTDNLGFFASDGGGFKATVGRWLQRWYVGQRTVGPDRNTKLPVPIGSMICQASADLLFADQPNFKIGDDDKSPTQLRLDMLADDNLYSTLGQAAETGAALGGVYLKINWDKSVVADRPFVEVVDADQALPDFRWGRLIGVTFWHVIARDGDDVWRHLERHELDAQGNGVIIHGLFQGKEDTLGVRVPLDTLPATTPLAIETQEAAVVGQISSNSPGLCVVYVPNQTPNRLWRSHPIARNFGRSDLDGVEHLMDALAETFSSWMRAERAAKARVFYDKSLLQNPGPGMGTVLDQEQEVYVGVDSQVSGPGVKMTDKVQVLQPTFDTAPYAATAQALVEQIIQATGFSLQTFGMDQTSSRSADTTATEIEARERRTYLTRDRKIREWKPATAALLKKLLMVDKAIFGTPNVIDDVWVQFPEAVQESPLRLAQTNSALYAAQSASMLERVKIQHPDWNEDQWAAEVKAIKSEFATVVDPTADSFDTAETPDPAEAPEPGQPF